jgi:hypothetical protein
LGGNARFSLPRNKEPRRLAGLVRCIFVAHHGNVPDEDSFIFSQHLVAAETRRLLARREVLERGEEFTNDGLRRHQQVDVPEPPVVERVRRDLRAFVRIHAQVKMYGVRSTTKGSCQILSVCVIGYLSLCQSGNVVWEYRLFVSLAF